MNRMYSLGIELSTQSAKLVVLDLLTAQVVYTGSFNFDNTFPNYNTVGGVLPSDTADIRQTSPFMLVSALEYAFAKMVDNHIDLSCVKSIKTDCMQHCTVYTDSRFGDILGRLKPGQDLVEQIGPCITRNRVPIWEDRSPVKEVAFLSEQLKEKGGISAVTGNRSELRFPAAQILKWATESPRAYENTSHIFILSAFITSIMAGRIVPVDTGDGWGTNLNHMEIHRPGWSKDVLAVMDACLNRVGIKSSLDDKLGEMTHYDDQVGLISPYFVEKYGVDPNCIILAGTGDNPATLLGCGGHMVISLGTSYTVNGVMDRIVPSMRHEYNIFGYTREKAMALSVITNGGKVHAHFFEKYMGNEIENKENATSWQAYEKKAGSVDLKEDEKLMLPYLMDESVPLKRSGIFRDGFSGDGAGTNIRALHLSQVLSIKRHAGHLGRTNGLCIAGGGSNNRLMAQWIADAFDIKTYLISGGDTAAPLGCAISGAVSISENDYRKAANRFVKIEVPSICHPISENVEAMKTLLCRYGELEKRYSLT
jgi:xylulokinase